MTTIQTHWFALNVLTPHCKLEIIVDGIPTKLVKEIYCILHSLYSHLFSCATRCCPQSCAGCRADFGSIAVATETGADVTLVAGRLAGTLTITVMKMQLDGTSSVALRGEERGLYVCELVWMDGGRGGEGRGWHWVNSPHPPTHASAHTHTLSHSDPMCPQGTVSAQPVTRQDGV